LQGPQPRPFLQFGAKIVVDVVPNIQIAKLQYQFRGFCIPELKYRMVEDSAVGVAAAVDVGMRAIGFVAGSHAGSRLADHLRSLGASAAISDMRALKSTTVDMRGW
jgi:hypothetical protein